MHYEIEHVYLRQAYAADAAIFLQSFIYDSTLLLVTVDRRGKTDLSRAARLPSVLQKFANAE